MARKSGGSKSPPKEFGDGSRDSEVPVPAVDKRTGTERIAAKRKALGLPK